MIIIKVAIGMPTKDSGMLCIMPGEKKKKRGHAQLQKHGEESTITIPAQP